MAAVGDANAFVSIKGSDYRCLKQALDRGDLPLVKASAAQLPSVDLPTALDIALLVMEQEPQNGERAAVRWLGRLCVERRDVTLAQVREALDAPYPARRGTGGRRGQTPTPRRLCDLGLDRESRGRREDSPA